MLVSVPNVPTPAIIDSHLRFSLLPGRIVGSRSARRKNQRKTLRMRILSVFVFVLFLSLIRDLRYYLTECNRESYLLMRSDLLTQGRA